MKKTYLLRMPEDLHRDLKSYSAGLGMTMMEFIESAIRGKIAKAKLAAAMMRLRAQEDERLEHDMNKNNQKDI